MAIDEVTDEQVDDSIDDDELARQALAADPDVELTDDAQPMPGFDRPRATAFFPVGTCHRSEPGEW